MNSRKHLDHDPFDTFIGRSLKNWLERQNPPADSREKLLYTASTGTFEKSNYRELWQHFLQYLALRVTSGLAANRGQFQYTSLPYHSLSINANFHTSAAYETMIRSVPAGRTLLCFLY